MQLDLSPTLRSCHWLQLLPTVVNDWRQRRKPSPPLQSNPINYSSLSARYARATSYAAVRRMSDPCQKAVVAALDRQQEEERDEPTTAA